MFKTIIVGVDGSDAALRAVDAACSVTDEDAKLWFVHTTVPDTAAFATGAIAGYQMVNVLPDADEMQKIAQEIIDKAKKHAGRDVAGHVICQGDPGDEILRVAKEKSADLIVTGRRGLGNIAGLLIGSTSQRISHHATCAVLTVP